MAEITTELSNVVVAGELEWVTPDAAVSALAAVYGNRLTSKSVLADLLLDGHLRARAARSWFSDVEYISDAWRERHEVETDEAVLLVSRDWMDSEDWFNDLNRWRWPQARFVLTTSEDPREWRFLEGVEFAEPDMRRAVDLAVGAASRGKGGPNPDIQRWARFWEAVVSLSQDGGLNRLKLRSRNELYKELEKRDPTIFGQRSVDPWLNHVWERFLAG